MPQIEMHDRSDSQAAAPLRVLIASDVRFIRESLHEVLGRHAGLSILGQSSDAAQTLRMSRELRPDMVLLDAAAREGLVSVRRLRDMRCSLRIVAFAVAETVDTV